MFLGRFRESEKVTEPSDNRFKMAEQRSGHKKKLRSGGTDRVTKRQLLNPVSRTRSTASGPEDYSALVSGAAAGDQAAMERLLMKAQEVAWRFSLSVCGHADDAEDAMQEALIKTYRYAGQIRDGTAFRPWLYRTVRNACLIGRRKRVHEPRHLESLDAPTGAERGTSPRDPEDPARDPEQQAVSTERRQALQKALRALPGQYRAVLFLREMEGLSTREVASVLEISEDNVKARLHRARVALQKSLTRVDR
jgi:RNA polymerase sigma-70 factor (ECF subfamily)